MDPWQAIEWGMRTPDGQGLRVHRDGDLWVVESGGAMAKSRILDVALIEVIRTDSEVEGHQQITDYAAWIRRQAASIEGSSPPEPAAHLATQ